MPLDEVLKTIIAEAAGEGEQGMYAVASTIANRSARRRLTPQQVVNQPHQYTGRWRRDLEAFVARQPPSVIAQAQRAWTRAQTNPLPGVDHYLTTDLYQSPDAPAWAKTMGNGQVIGRHVFLDSRPQGQLRPPRAPQPMGQLRRP